MKWQNFLAATLAAIAMLAPGTAQAQQTADVDVVASLEVAETSLTVSGVRDMQFGVVTIPDSSRAISNVVCSYDLRISPNGFVTVRFVRESPDFDATPIQGTSLSGCEFRNAPLAQGAGFEITCAPNIMTNYQISWAANNADPAINFLPPPAFVANFYVGGNRTVLPDAPSGSASSGSVSCPAGGAIEVLVGGTLQVGRTAVVASDISVGSVSLAVNY